MNPTKNYKSKLKSSGDNRVDFKSASIDSRRSDLREMEEYLKKLFSYLDQNK